MKKQFNNDNLPSFLQTSQLSFKQCIFSLVHQLLKFASESNILLIFFIIVDTYQFLWYAVSPAFGGSGDSLQWYQTALRYLQLDNAFRNNKASLLLSLLYIFFGWHLIYLLLLVFCVWKLRKSSKKSTKNMNRLFKFVSLSTIFMNTIICLPISQTYLTFMICKSDNPIYGSLTCYQGEYFIHFFVAIFGFLIHFFSVLIFGLFFREFNPFHDSIVSGPFERSFMLRQGLKVLLPFYTLVSFSQNWKATGVILYGIYMLGLLILRYRQNPSYKRWWFAFVIGSEGLVFWAIICQLIHLAVDTSDQGRVGSAFFLICSPVVVFGVIKIIESRAKQIKFKSIKSLARDVDVELYINILLNLIRNRRKHHSLMELEGFVKYHTKICTNLTCPCSRLMNPREPNFEPKKEIWYLWLQSLLKEGIEKFPKSASLHIFSAFLFYEKLHNKFKALYEIETVSSLKHSVEQACVAYRLKETIEHHMIHDDQKFVETSGLDFKQAYIFYQKFLLFEHLIGETTSLQVNFWIELLEKNPKPQILETKGIQIVTRWEKIAKIYQKLMTMNSNHIPTLRLYGDFLKDVANDPTESTKVIDKIENAATTTNIKQQLNETDEHQDFEEYQKSFITLYGDSKRLGLVKDITPEITKILGYTRNDLLDQTLNNICPKIFEDFQERLFSTIMERPDLSVLNSNSIAFFMNKEGYLVLCSVVVYLVPDLKDGLVFLFFIRKIEDDEDPFAKYKLPYYPGRPHYIIYNTQTELIYGYTKNCWTSFGIPSHLIENVETEGEFRISDILPDFFSIDQEQLKGTKGVASVIDTTNLDQKFILKRNNNSSYASSSENTEDQINNRKKVPVFLSGVEEPFICGPNIQYLRIIEQEIEDLESPNRVVQQDNYINNNDRNPHLEGESKFDLEQSMNSDAPLGSNIFSLDSLNEDVKLMTEFRNLMAKKTMTKSTKRLLIGIINFFLILIGMESYEYNMVTQQVQEVKTGFSDISLAYARFTTMAEVNFFVRELQYLAKYPTSINAVYYIPVIQAFNAYQIALLQEIQYQLTASILSLQNTKFTSIENKDITFEDSQDGVVSTESLYYIDGFFKYMTALTRVRNATLPSFVSQQNPLDSTLDNLYMIRRNGYGPLRAGAEQTISNFNSYHSDRLDMYGRKYLIALILLLVILVGACSTITLLIFSIEGKKCFILSLFGYIPMEELEELLQKCQDFADKYLEGVSSYEHEKSLLTNESKSHQSLHDMTFKADRSLHSNNGEDSSMFNMSENIKAAPIAQFQLTPRDMTYSAVKSSNPEDLESQTNSLQTNPVTLRLPQDQNFLSTSSYMLGSETKRPLQQTLREENTTERERSKFGPSKTIPKMADKFNLIQELGEDRAQHLYRVKKAERSSFTKFTFSGLIFWSGIFILQYFMVERWFIDKTTVIYHHMNLNFGRMAYLKYVTAFYFEEIAEADTNSVYSYAGQTNVVNLRLLYEGYVQNINKEIAYSPQAGLPRVFNDYLELFQIINYDNLCPLIYDGADLQLCETGSLTNVKNGLSLSIISDLTNIDAAIKDFQTDLAAITTTNATQKAIEVAAAQWKSLASESAQQITLTIYSLSPVLTMLNDAYTAAFGKFISFANRTIKAIYASFVGFCIVLTFCWIFYVLDVDKRLRRTRSVLNMIPVETMATNENLKSAVLSENFQAILKQ